MKAGYAAMMPSGKRTRCATAIIDIVMHRLPPALSPAKHTRSPVQPDIKHQEVIEDQELPPAY